MYDQEESSADMILTTFKSLTKLKEQLRYVLLILYQLDNKGQQKFHAQILKIEKYLKNVKLMRMVGERDAMVDEHPIEYFGKDYGYDDPFIYNAELETLINKVEIEMLAILGLVLKHLKQHFHISDNM